jgi:uncharacterized protein YdaU (DUF1376 family)
MQMSPPWMPLHVGDYLKNTGHLRAAGHGAYVMLIMHYWTTGGLPSDPRQLAAIARMTDEEWQEWQPIIQAFFHDGWKHKRIDKEIAEALEKYKKQVESGRAGGKAAQAKNRGSLERPFKQNGSEPRANGRADVEPPTTYNHLRKRSDPSVLKEGKEAAGGPVRIHYNDPQWDAWERYLRKTTGKGSPQDRNFGWIFPSLWPPGHPGAP